MLDRQNGLFPTKSSAAQIVEYPVDLDQSSSRRRRLIPSVLMLSWILSRLQKGRDLMMMIDAKMIGKLNKFIKN